MILEVNDAGELVLPAELVQVAPHSKIDTRTAGPGVVVCWPVPDETAPRAAPLRSVLDLPTFPAGPVDPHMTFRREDLYDDDGR